MRHTETHTHTLHAARLRDYHREGRKIKDRRQSRRTDDEHTQELTAAVATYTRTPHISSCQGEGLIRPQLFSEGLLTGKGGRGKGGHFSYATTHKLLNHLPPLLMQASLLTSEGHTQTMKVGSKFVGNKCFSGRMGDETV